MGVENIFVQEGIQEVQLKEWLRQRFKRAGYSRCQIQRTPLGIRITVWVEKPGMVIGKSGKRVEEITEEVGKLFKLENPMIDVREIENPFLDAQIVADKIAKALEQGAHFKRVGNYYADRVMEAGARGVEVRISGKLAGVERSRYQMFRRGYIAKSGEYKEVQVDCAYAQALIKPGIVGVEVQIMRKLDKALNL